MKRSQAPAALTLKVRKFNTDTELCINLRPEDANIVSDLKKAAAKELDIPWWQQQWIPTKEGADYLANHSALDVSRVPEITCVRVRQPYFPLDIGNFNHLVVTGEFGSCDPWFPKPDENGRFVASGDDPEDFEIPDAVVLDGRLLTIKGDGRNPQVLPEGEPFTNAGWSEEVLLDADNAPILVGWRVRYLSGGWPGPSFGLATKHQLSTGVQYENVNGALKFCFEPDESKVECSPDSFKIGSKGENVTDSFVDGVRARIVTVDDDKFSIEYTDEDDSTKQSHVNPIKSEFQLVLTSSSSPASVGGDEVSLPKNDVGGHEYDVFVVFDSAKKEVRASVGWGCPGSRIDKVVVPPEVWPAADLPLVPFVSLSHSDFCGMNIVKENEETEQLPITVEALTKNQIPEEAVHALMQ